MLVGSFGPVLKFDKDVPCGSLSIWWEFFSLEICVLQFLGTFLHCSLDYFFPLLLISETPIIHILGLLNRFFSFLFCSRCS